MLLSNRRPVVFLLVAASIGLEGCTEQRPPLKIAEPLSAEESKRWSELLHQGSAPPQIGQDAEPAPGTKR